MALATGLTVGLNSGLSLTAAQLQVNISFVPSSQSIPPQLPQMAGTKRKAAAKQADSKKQQKQDGQKAVSHDIDVPIDEGFNGDGELLKCLPNPS